MSVATGKVSLPADVQELRMISRSALWSVPDSRKMRSAEALIRVWNSFMAPFCVTQRNAERQPPTVPVASSHNIVSGNSPAQ